MTKYISNNFRKIKVAFSCFRKNQNLMSIYSRMTKKLKNNVVIKKSRTFAFENEYYLVARPTFMETKYLILNILRKICFLK